MLRKSIFGSIHPKKVSVKTLKPLAQAYNDKCFWVENGPVLSNLRDLNRALTAMTEKQYEHHVHSSRNDFAQWVEQVLADKECADSLRKADSRKEASKVVEKFLKHYII